MRSLLQLRTPEGGNGERPEFRRPDTGYRRRKRPLPASVFASRKSRWRTAPAARPAAGWSRDCLRLSCSARLPNRWVMPPSFHRRSAHRDHDRQFRGEAAAFPGGSIGELAVNGTVNDLAVSGARAEALVCHLRTRSGLADGDPRSRSTRHGECRSQGGREDRRRRYQGRRAWQSRSTCTSRLRESGAAFMA